jgi:hypothetical protein
MLRPMIGRPVCLAINNPSGAYDQIFITDRQWRFVDVETDLSFIIAASPRQGSHCRVQVPWDLRLYFTLSDSRLPLSSPPTARRVTV